MDHFAYRDRVLHCEDVPVPELAEKYGTPVFVYSTATLLHHLSAIQTAFAAAKPIIAYSVKTNGNLSICKLMAEHGAGFDVTSGGELFRALKAGSTGVEDRLRRGRQDRRGNALRAGEQRLPVQRRERGGAVRPRRRGEGDGPEGPGRAAGQPGPAAEDARQDRHQRQGGQVRPRHRDGAGGVAEGGRAPGAGHRRRPHAPRLADPQGRPVPRGGGQGGRTRHASSASRGTRSST